MKCTQRLYLTADRKRVVPQGHKAAATLYASPGDEIPNSAAEMFGLVDGALPEKKGGKGKPAPANKEKQAGSDKQKDAGGDKGDDGKPAAPAKVSLTDVAGIGAATAKTLTAVGIDTVEKLAALDPAAPPEVTGLSPAFSWSAVVEAAKARVPEAAAEAQAS